MPLHRKFQGLYIKNVHSFSVFFFCFFFVLEAGHSPRSPTLRFSRYYKYAASIMSEKTCLSTFESGWFHCAQHYICVYISTPHFKAVYDFFFFFFMQKYLAPIAHHSILNEAGDQRCSVKKMVLEISQNSQENISALGLQLYQKRDSGTGVFL